MNARYCIPFVGLEKLARTEPAQNVLKLLTVTMTGWKEERTDLN
jgi:hypothetical protein